MGTVSPRNMCENSSVTGLPSINRSGRYPMPGNIPTTHSRNGTRADDVMQVGVVGVFPLQALLDISGRVDQSRLKDGIVGCGGAGEPLVQIVLEVSHIATAVAGGDCAVTEVKNRLNCDRSGAKSMAFT